MLFFSAIQEQKLLKQRLSLLGNLQEKKGLLHVLMDFMDEQLERFLLHTKKSSESLLSLLFLECLLFLLMIFRLCQIQLQMKQLHLSSSQFRVNLVLLFHFRIISRKSKASARKRESCLLLTRFRLICEQENFLLTSMKKLSLILLQLQRELLMRSEE